MKFIEFNAVQISPDQKNPDTINVLKYKTKVNPELVCSLSPIMVPGSIQGPTGMPIPIEGTRIIFGATYVVVEMSMKRVEESLTNADSPTGKFVTNMNGGK